MLPRLHRYGGGRRHCGRDRLRISGNARHGNRRDDQNLGWHLRWRVYSSHLRLASRRDRLERRQRTPKGFGGQSYIGNSFRNQKRGSWESVQIWIMKDLENGRKLAPCADRADVLGESGPTKNANRSHFGARLWMMLLGAYSPLTTGTATSNSATKEN